MLIGARLYGWIVALLLTLSLLKLCSWLKQHHDAILGVPKQLAAPQAQHRTNQSSVPSLCLESSRCRTMYTNKTFSFVHISKNGGSSWMREFKNVVGKQRLFPEREQGAEFSVVHQNKIAGPWDFLSYHMVSLRNPRSHVWSLFMECRYDEWGIYKTNNTNFPRTGTTPEADVQDYRVWLNHFLDSNHTTPTSPVGPGDSFNCYQAANFQSNYFASETPNPGHSTDPREKGVEPNLALALDVYNTMDFVAFTDFFHESKCLLYHRLEPKTKKILDYLENTCHCATTHDDRHDVKISHTNGEGHRSTMRDLPLDILRSVEALTRVDVMLYKDGLKRFMGEVVWLESSGQLGRRVMCTSVLAKWEPELAYLGLSVSALYQEEKNGLISEM